MRPWLQRMIQAPDRPAQTIPFLASGGAILIVRLFLDQLTSPYPLGAEWILNQCLWYLAAASILLAAGSLLLPLKLSQSIRVFPYFALLTCLPPLLAQIPGLGQKAIYTGSFREYPLFARLTEDVSLAEWISLAVFLLALAAFINALPGKALKKALSILLLFILFGVLLYLPILLPKLYGILGKGPIEAPLLWLSKYYLLISLIALAALLYLHDPARFESVLADFRIVWIIHSLLLIGLGIVLFSKASFNPSPLLSRSDFLPDLLLIFVAMTYAGVFVTVINNLADEARDADTSRDRPLASGLISPKQYQQIGWSSLLIAALAALMVGFTSLLTLLLATGTWILYSSPPFRLKRYPLLPKLLLGLQSLALAYLGFSLGGALQSPFPADFILFCLFSIALALHFRDLEHPQADARHGIRSLPVSLGLPLGRSLIALALALHYTWMCLLVASGGEYLPLAALGAIQVLLIFQKPFNTSRSFFVYLAGLAVFVVQVMAHYTLN